MNRKIQGTLDRTGAFSPVTFMPGYRIRSEGHMLRIFRAYRLTGAPWPEKARYRALFQALDDVELLQQIVPAFRPADDKKELAVLEIDTGSSEPLQWEFEFESGILRIFDRQGLDIHFSGDRYNDEIFLFRGRGFREYRLLNGNASLEYEENVYKYAHSKENRVSIFNAQAEWEQLLNKKFSWWHEIFLKILALPPLEEKVRTDLLISVHQMLMIPETLHFFDGDFSWWCQAAAKLKFSYILKKKFQDICALAPVWQYNAKCYSGIDDGLRLPKRSDLNGNPIEMNWMLLLDSSSSALTASAMFDYCNTAYDMAFLKDYAFEFMTRVMQVIELSVTPADYQLQLPVSPLPGGRCDSLNSHGKNSDRQLYYIHRLIVRLIKAAELLQLKPDPVWIDIAARLPRARGEWQLQPETEWGKAAKRVCEILK